MGIQCVNSAQNLANTLAGALGIQWARRAPLEVASEQLEPLQL
jgi:hypothetical protein